MFDFYNLCLRSTLHQNEYVEKTVFSHLKMPEVIPYIMFISGVKGELWPLQNDLFLVENNVLIFLKLFCIVFLH